MSGGAVCPLEAYTSWTGGAGFGALGVMSLSRTPPLALVTCTAPHRRPEVTP
jgi:hypothetical protein